jgi:ribosomal protein S18 acetylase RimI-like enzyme
MIPCGPSSRLPAPPEQVACAEDRGGLAVGGPIALVDWRHAPAGIVAALFEREQREWWDVLAWDASDQWRVLETARRTWGLPGLLAVDAHHRVRGWTYFHQEERRLLIGALVADSRQVTGMLVEAAVDTARRAGIPDIACFLPERAVGVHDVLAARGFAVEPFLYMAKTIAPSLLDPRAASRVAALGAELVVDCWRRTDVQAAAELLAMSYGLSGRHCAPGGRLEEWEGYVRRLIEHPGCGAFDVSSSLVLRDVGAGPGGLLRALVIMTTISAAATHVAQLAVHPNLRRRGVARCLVEAACVRAALGGKRRATLIVARENRAAYALYRALGFEPAASFLSARREATRQPVRSTSVALARGGETTRL